MGEWNTLNTFIYVRRPNGFLGLSLNERTIQSLVVLHSQSDKTVFALGRSPTVHIYFNIKHMYVH